MKDIVTINEFFKGYKLPSKKTPVLKWLKNRPTKKEVELGFCPNESLAMYCNLETGATGYYLCDVIEDTTMANCIDRTSKDEFRYFCEFIPELDGFVFGEAKINARSIKMANIKEFIKYKEELANKDLSEIRREQIERSIKDLDILRQWELNGIIFISKDKQIAYSDCGWFYDYNIGRYCWGNSEPMTWHDKLTSKAPFKVDNIQGENPGIDGESFSKLVEPLLTVFPRICNIGGNRTVDISENGITLGCFLKYKEPKGRVTKKQKQINSLLELSLSEIAYNESYNFNMAFVEQIKPGLCVLRTMTKNDTDKIMVDGARIYVSKNDVIACRPTNEGKWINMPLNSYAIHWDFVLENFSLDIVKGTKMEYFGSVIEDIPDNLKGKYLWALLTYPVIEQLSKAGFKNTVIYKIKQVSSGNVMDYIQSVFGEITPKKSLTDSLNLNKYQLKEFAKILNSEEYYTDHSYGHYIYYHSFTPIVYMKKIFGEELRDLDNNTFDQILKSLVDVYNTIKKYPALWNSWMYSSCIDGFVAVLKLLKETYSVAAMKKMYSKLLLFIDAEGEIAEKNEKIRKESGGYYSRHTLNVRNDFRYYRDYLNMVQQMNETAHFRPEFDESNLDSVKEMHDMAMELFYLKKQDIEDEKFASMSHKWDKWLYENDSYVIIAPKCSGDLAREGLELHHCVKSYVGRVVNDITNILFIREKTDVDKPFFTVEITNDSVIQQVHGFGNRNSNTEPGLDDFIKEWVKACKLKTSNFNKVR